MSGNFLMNSWNVCLILRKLSLSHFEISFEHVVSEFSIRHLHALIYSYKANSEENQEHPHLSTLEHCFKVTRERIISKWANKVVRWYKES